MPFIEIVQQLKSRQPLPPLYPGHPWSQELSQKIENDELFGDQSTLNSQQQTWLRAGLLVWNDDIMTAHELVQDDHSPTAAFWHAIIHRREGDLGNAHYWWRRTGEHPAFEQLFSRAQSTLGAENESSAQEFLQHIQSRGSWQPMEFVARCEMARRGQFPIQWLQRLQVVEFETLLDWCSNSA